MKKILKNIIATFMCLLVFFGSSFTLAYDLSSRDHKQQGFTQTNVTYDYGSIKLMGDPMPGPF